jgi:hypothetical protein
MTEEKLKQASRLRSEWLDARDMIDRISDEYNWMGIPKEMFERHRNEKVAFFEEKVERAKKEFSEL